MTANPDKIVLKSLRKDYRKAVLIENEVSSNPFKQFEKWFQEALQAQLYEPNAMTLATVGQDRKPSARIVLLKGFSSKGFIFYTNYLSRKGKELAKNSAASLLFYWSELERQIRIEGTVEKLTKEESEKYFYSRPKASQIGAIISPQSQEITNRNWLDEKQKELGMQYQNQDPVKPSHWGGYIVKPQIIEFWQGRTSRLHDRIVYKKTNKADWKIVRLAP